MKTVILPFASLSTHAFHVLDTTRSNPFQEHGTTLDRSPRQVIHPFQKRAMVVVSQHKPGENVSDHNISSGPNDEASSSGALQPSLPVNNANFPVKEGNQGNMPEQSVWVKVIQKTGGDNYEDLGDPFQILPRPANVSDLRNKVKEEAANTLAHVDANELLVFAPDKDYENDKPQLSVSGAMADRDDKAEGDKRDSSPAKGGGRGRMSGMGRGRGRGGARHASDYWSLAQPEFRQWLSNITTKAEYNRLSIAERGQLLRDFGISQQRGDGDTPQVSLNVCFVLFCLFSTIEKPLKLTHNLFHASQPTVKGLLKEEPSAKKAKNFSELVAKDDYQAAVKLLKESAGGYLARGFNPKVYREPHLSMGTWNKEEIQQQLCKKRELIEKRLASFKPTDRQKVVLGLRCGSGFGKTHILTEAPELLAAEGLYVTYNQYQDLSTDKDDPVKALLIRLLLAMCGCASHHAGQFFKESASRQFFDVSVETLRACFVGYAKERFEAKDLVIGVDEVMDLAKLSFSAAQLVISELAYLSFSFKSNKPVSRCTVLVSSLEGSVFRTKSGRPVEDWNPRKANRAALEYFAASTAGDKENYMALVNAICGAHMRSIVVAFDLLKQGHAPRVRDLYNSLYERMGLKLTVPELSEVCVYVEACITSKADPSPSNNLESIVGEDLAVPPVITMKAFDNSPALSKRLEELFNAFHLCDGGPGKQLEEISKAYDFFRAELRLPIVPAKARICIPKGPGFETAEWFRSLRFPQAMEESRDALLETRSVLCGSRSRKEVVATVVVPTFGMYYHPAVSNHPWLDRLVVGQHSKDSFCLVIYQDKVNAADFPDACKKLNKAANVLSGPHQVLLVVNVIGATTNTTAQASLERPYILIREGDEVSSFYSRNFAEMVRYSRERHLLSTNSKTV